jgi:glutamate racemase
MVDLAVLLYRWRKDMKIGFFDSGAGGITVLYKALLMLPDEDYVYYADIDHVPYGTKPKEEVKKYILDAVKFISEKQVKAIVIACNTATSVAIKELREIYQIPIIGMEPAVKPAIENNSGTKKRVLVTATALTLKEEKLHNLIDRLDNDHIVDLLPLPGLVQFSEQLEFREEVVLPYLLKELSGYDLNIYETVVMGCTHFSYFKDMFKKLFPSNTLIIDGNIGTLNNLKRTLQTMDLLHEGSGRIDFYQSGVRLTDKDKLEKYQILFQRLEEIYKE